MRGRKDDDRNRRLPGRRHEDDGDDRVHRMPRECRDDGERNEKAKQPGSDLLGKRDEDEED